MGESTRTMRALWVSPCGNDLINGRAEYVDVTHRVSFDSRHKRRIVVKLVFVAPKRARKKASVRCRRHAAEKRKKRKRGKPFQCRPVRCRSGSKFVPQVGSVRCALSKFFFCTNTHHTLSTRARALFLPTIPHISVNRVRRPAPSTPLVGRRRRHQRF